MAASDIIIKIFSGPHLGAEIPLSPGTHTVGSSHSCDIILQDSTVAERHLSITIPDDPGDTENIIISTIDTPVVMVIPETEELSSEQDSEALSDDTDDDRPAPDESREEQTQLSQELKPGEQLIEGKAAWKSLTPLMVGTTCIAWKTEKNKWGDIAVSGLFAGKMFAAGEDDGSLSPEEQARADEAAKQDKNLIDLPPIALKLLKALGVLLIFLLVFGPCIGGKSTRLAKDMRNILEDEGFDYLSVSQTNIGVTVLGIVDTQADRSRLWQIAGKADYPVFLDIRVNEERAYAVKVALSVRGLFPEVELKDKNILIKGYMRDKLIEGASKIWIKNDISEVETIESSMVYAFQVWPVLKDRLIKHKLENAVIIRFHPGLVQVEGELNFDQRQTLEKVKEEVTKALKSPVAFWDTLTAPGFSDEWNTSLNAGQRSKYSPDPGLARLFLDSQNAKGAPAFVASAPSHKAGKVKPSTPRNEKGMPLKDADGNIIPMVPARDAQGHIIKDKDGTPLLVPAFLNKFGKLIKDKFGNPMAPRVITGTDKQPVYDKDGYLILDKDANKVLEEQKTTGIPEGASGPKESTDAASDRGSDPSDKDVFGSGTAVADKLNKQEEQADPLGGLSITSITIDPIPFISMRDGQKFFTGGKLPSGYVIETISTEKLVLTKNGKTKTFNLRLE